jgi:hypothetical protein
LVRLYDKIDPKVIGKMVGLWWVTLYVVKNKYLGEGLSSLDEKPSPYNHIRKINEHEETIITSIACSAPEEGNSQSTLRLIREKFVELSHFESV